ncbi:ExbD/TolR family protein [Crocinitomix algicola]|uniref:ExbD/TolR family protein n=1 Tax=Crocinitomix algicola TaxID=1740263 RepID=UPI000871D3AE|nr:biopolymer transporter ExbD [Crocinitomix algicola]
MNLGRRNRVKAEGGMSSMTDLVFLLLIFFIIMSTMTEPGIPVNLPSGPSSETGPEKSVLNVGVTPENKYVLTDDPTIMYDYEEIEPIIIAKMADDLTDNDKIKISGDRDADYQFVFRLIALSKQNKWKPILVFDK